MCLLASGCSELVFHPCRAGYKACIWLQRWMTLVLLFSVVVHFIRSVLSLSCWNVFEQEPKWQQKYSALQTFLKCSQWLNAYVVLTCSFATLVLRSSFSWAVIHSWLQVKNRKMKNNTAAPRGLQLLPHLQTHSKDLAGRTNFCLSCKETKWRLNIFILSVHYLCNELSPWLRFYPEAWLIALQPQGPFLSVPS